MKVLHVSPTFYPATAWGGPIVSTYGLCNAMAQLEGVNLKVLTTDAAGPSVADRVDRRIAPTFERYEVDFCRRLMGHSFSPVLLSRLRHWIQWADCIHLTGVFSSPTIPTLFWARRLRKPVVWSPRGSFKKWTGSRKPKLKALWTAACDKLLVPGSSVLHVTSEDERDESSSKITRAQIRVLPNGVEVPAHFVRGREFLADGVVELLYIGRLHEIKGIEQLIEALHLLRGSCNVRLTISGKGDPKYLDALRRLVKARNLEQGVTFTGFVEGQEKDQLFGRADVCVLPSYTENFGMVVAEALARGLPVVASKGTPWARLSEMQCGLWVENTPDALALGIERISAMPLKEMGERGRAWMTAEFGWASIAREMLRVYQKLAEVSRS